MFELDGWLHECGVIGFIRGNPAHRLLDMTYEGLLSLQHRGQEAAGLALADGRHVRKHKGWGRIDVAIPGSTMLELARDYDGAPFEPCLAIGHVRYATAGSSDLRNAQPHYIEPASGRLVLASNGDVANYREIRRWLENEGVEINTENDGELLLKTIDHLRTRHGFTLVDAIKRMSQIIRGTWSALLMSRDHFYAFRDPRGNRPFCRGQLGDTLIFASETCALDHLGAKVTGEVEPGQIIEYDLKTGALTTHRVSTDGLSQCIFEHIYFARPDSVVFGDEVGQVRTQLGRLSAERHPAPRARFVAPVPESGIFGAMGFAERSELPFRWAIIRNSYVGRTFIMPGQDDRIVAVRRKFNPMHVVWGTPDQPQDEAVLSDDTIVRGTTTQELLRLVSRACRQQTGRPAKIHFRLSAPPVRYPCPYGIDTPTRAELIAAQNETPEGVKVEAIREFIGAASLGYATVEDLRSCVTCPDSFCYACFTGDYSLGIKDSWSV